MHTAHSISQPEVSSNNRRLGCSQMASIEYHTLHIFHSRFGFRAMQSVCDNVYMTFFVRASPVHLSPYHTHGHAMATDGHSTTSGRGSGNSKRKKVQ